MKSIEEAAKECAGLRKDKIIDDEERYYNGHHCEKYDCFKAGVEFAQRWIPIEEELPESSDKLLIVKYKDAKGNDKYGLAKYFDMSFMRKNKSKSLNFTIQGSCPRNVTHWRQIELK